MKRNVGWMVPAVMLLAGTAWAEEPRGVVTTLPRPVVSTWVASDAPTQLPPPGDGPLLLPVPPPGGVEAAPALPPIGEDWDGETRYRRRVRADLLEAAILFPVVYQSLTAPVGPQGGAIVRLPTAGLGVSAPFIANVQFDAWRYGTLNLGYKLLAAEGNAILLNFDPAGPALLRSRLDMNVVDLAFTSSGYGSLWNLLWFANQDPLKPLWGLRWDLGARVATVFFDSTAAGPTLEQHVSSHFVGGGPRVGLTLHRLLGTSGAMLFTRADFGFNMGSVNQQFSELDRDPAGNPTAFGYLGRTDFRAVPTLALQFGIGGEPPLTHRGQWQVAYQFEQWWGVGSGGGSAADLVTHGVVLRWMYNY